jgi:hypothetical protein
MTDRPRNNVRRTPMGRPFEPGNPGRPKGAKHKTTLAIEALLDGQAEALTQKAIDAALAGDTTALRLCLDRIAPPPKGRRVSLDLPQIETAADVTRALSAAVQAVASGEITLDEAGQVAGLLEAQRKAIETADLEARLAALETKGDKK